MNEVTEDRGSGDFEDQHPVILFDGVCNLCNGAIQFIIKHDPKAIFRFAALQSEYSKKYREHFGLNIEGFDSIILVVNGQASIQSDAVMLIARLLGFPWFLLVIGYLFPRWMRDKVYDIVAANRYRWFGQKSACMIPTPDILDRFLE